MTTMEELARKMLKARRDYFCALDKMNTKHSEWRTACNDLLGEMDDNGAECLVIDGKVVVFDAEYYHSEDNIPVIESLFSIHYPWTEPSE